MQLFKLYSDGNYFPRAKKSGFGGYIEDASGQILVEFSEQIKVPEYQHSFELLGIIRGLQLAKAKGIKKLISHCDDKNTTLKLKEIFEDGIFNVSTSLKPELYKEIIELSKDFEYIKFSYIPRNNNKYADSLSRKYASLMEQNFIRQYEDDIFRSQCRFEKGQNLNKKSYFCHKVLRHTAHKNNPFLVANVRNKKVRRVIKDEKKIDYNFLYVEFFTKNEDLYLRSFNYDSKYNLISKNESIRHNPQDKELELCNFISKAVLDLKEIGIKNLWIHTNHTTINRILEQKDKLTMKQWEGFYNIHKSLEGLDRCFVNTLPFVHKFSPEIESIESSKKNIEKTLLTIEQLIEEMDNADFSKDKGKYFGAIIRHQLQEFRDNIERDLTSKEVENVINETIIKLKVRGCKDVPSVTNYRPK